MHTVHSLQHASNVGHIERRVPARAVQVSGWTFNNSRIKTYGIVKTVTYKVTCAGVRACPASTRKLTPDLRGDRCGHVACTHARA